MPGKTNKTILLGMLLPGQERWPRREHPLGLPGTLEMRYFPPQIGVIRGTSDESLHRFSRLPASAGRHLAQSLREGIRL